MNISDLLLVKNGLKMAKSNKTPFSLTVISTQTRNNHKLIFFLYNLNERLKKTQIVMILADQYK